MIETNGPARRTGRTRRRGVTRWIAAVLVFVLVGCQPPLPPPPAPPVAAEMAADVGYLGDPDRDGRVLGSEGRDEAMQYIARGFRQAGLEPVIRQAFEVHGLLTSGEGANVAGIVRGTDPSLAGQYVVVGAHYDHIGRLAVLSRDPDQTGVRPGADDNASGAAALLELARRLARRPTARTIVFVAFDAEELGLLGSEHFVRHAPLPLDSAVAMVNLDMVGRLRRGRLTIVGASTHPGWSGLLKRANDHVGLELRFRPPDDDSDHATFNDSGVPAIHLFTGLHAEYHTAGDRVELLNEYGMLRVVELAERVLRAVAASAAFAPRGRNAAPALSGTPRPEGP